MGIGQFFSRRVAVSTTAPPAKPEGPAGAAPGGRAARAADPHLPTPAAKDTLGGDRPPLPAKVERTVQTALTPPAPGATKAPSSAEERLVATLVDHDMPFDERMMTLAVGLDSQALRRRTAAGSSFLEQGVGALATTRTQLQHQDMIALISGLVLAKTQSALVGEGGSAVGEQVVTRALRRLLVADDQSIAALAHPVAELAILARGPQGIEALVEQSAAGPGNLLERADQVFQRALGDVLEGKSLTDAGALHRADARGIAQARSTPGMQEFAAQARVDLALMAMAKRAGLEQPLAHFFGRDNQVFTNLCGLRSHFADPTNADAQRLLGILGVMEGRLAERPHTTPEMRQELTDLLRA